MSTITDIVFVLPGTCDKRRNAERFADLFEQYPTGRRGGITFRPEPVEDTGSKVSGTVVFHLAANHVDYDFLDAVTSAPWPRGTVLWYQGDFDDYPHVVVWNEHEPIWHEWPTCSRCGYPDGGQPQHDCLTATNAKAGRLD